MGKVKSPYDSERNNGYRSELKDWSYKTSDNQDPYEYYNRKAKDPVRRAGGMTPAAREHRLFQRELNNRVKKKKK